MRAIVRVSAVIVFGVLAAAALSAEIMPASQSRSDLAGGQDLPDQDGSRACPDLGGGTKLAKKP